MTDTTVNTECKTIKEEIGYLDYWLVHRHDTVSLTTFIEYLRDRLNEYPNAFIQQAGDDCDDERFVIYVNRLENDEEYNRRIQLEKEWTDTLAQMHAERDLRELLEYKRLKTKFEN